jgi:hypothetical protein
MWWRSRDGPDGRPGHYLRVVRDGEVVGRYGSVEELAASPVPLNELVEQDEAGPRRPPAGATHRGGLLHLHCA